MFDLIVLPALITDRICNKRSVVDTRRCIRDGLIYSNSKIDNLYSPKNTVR